MKTDTEITTGAKICVVTAYNQDFAEVGDLTSEVNMVYCQRLGYDFRLHTTNFDPARHPSWSKIKFVREALKDHEWVFWIDADAMFTNHHIGIQYLIDEDNNSHDIFVCLQGGEWVYNFGVFLIRRCDWSFWLLDEIWNREGWEGFTYWEQDAFNQLVKAGKNEPPHDGLGTHMVNFHMRKFNSIYPSSDKPPRRWKPNDFVAHCYAHDVKKKAVFVREILEKVGNLMHNNTYQQMRRIVGKYLNPNAPLNILDVGSYDCNGTYTPLFQWTNWKYTGADISAGPNVNVVVDEKYEWKMFEDGQFDVVVSGQALEHMEYPWLAAKAMYRVCKVGGICAVIAPAVWVYHPAPKDCWRYYPDGMRSLFVGNAGFTELECSMNEFISEPQFGGRECVDTWFVGKKNI